MVNLPEEITVGHDLLTNCGEWAKKNLSAASRKIVLVSNPKVFRLYGEQTKKSLIEAGFDVFVWLMKDGERYKNFRSFETALKFFSRSGLTRGDAVIALGGGVVGDLTGFAAAVYLRGVDFLLIPTTLLSMIDSSVGGKTGINTEFGKNLVGAFHLPRGVLIDVAVLQTLAKREVVAGFCEAVKQGAVASRDLFEQTGDFLGDFPPQRFKNCFNDEYFIDNLENLISAQVTFKAEIVSQDATESLERSDAKSRKILNFGHTLAHALEKITDYRRFKHGEAVGWGILFAARLSEKLDILDKNELQLLNDVLHRIGSLPSIDDLDANEIIRLLKYDKKNINQYLQWILLEEIGKPKIVSGQNISDQLIKKTLREVLKT